MSLSSGYHLQMNDQTERKMQELGRYRVNLRGELVYRHIATGTNTASAASSLGLSMHKPPPVSHPSSACSATRPRTYPGWESCPRCQMWIIGFRESERVWDLAHTQLQQAVQRRKRFADARRAAVHTYHPGQRVWLSTRDLRLRLPCKS